MKANTNNEEAVARPRPQGKETQHALGIAWKTTQNNISQWWIKLHIQRRVLSSNLEQNDSKVSNFSKSGWQLLNFLATLQQLLGVLSSNFCWIYQHNLFMPTNERHHPIKKIPELKQRSIFKAFWNWTWWHIFEVASKGLQGIQRPWEKQTNSGSESKSFPEIVDWKKHER